jgi:uncharacterized protein YgiM (DUF1202 family)
VVTLIVLGALILGFWAQYRSAGERASRTETPPESTATVEPTATDAPEGEGGEGGSGESAPPAAGERVRVLAEGLNMRSNPMTSATVIKRLPKDQLLVLLEKSSGWYKVKDSAGDEGWVAAGGRYSELVAP